MARQQSIPQHALPSVLHDWIHCYMAICTKASARCHQLLPNPSEELNLAFKVATDRLAVQVAELSGENEQLHWQLASAKQKQQQAELAVQHDQSGRPTSSPANQTQAEALRHQLEGLRLHNTELQSELTAVRQRAKSAQAQALEQQEAEKQGRDNSVHASWELQHRVDNLNQENQSLLAHHTQLESRFENLTKQLAKAQHAQHVGAQSKADQAESMARTAALSEQVSNLMESSAMQVEQRHRLENEVASLQRKLTRAETALSQHQHRVRGHEEAESASSSRMAELQQQADGAIGENAALHLQCRQQAVDIKQLQNDVQVSFCNNRYCNLVLQWIHTSNTSACGHCLPAHMP